MPSERISRRNGADFASGDEASSSDKRSGQEVGSHKDGIDLYGTAPRSKTVMRVAKALGLRFPASVS
jgi:hypothetical protein